MLRRLILPLLFGLAGTGVLIALGVWQMQRLEWKEAILADIDQRITGTPVAIPVDPDPEADRFLPVTASGRIAGQEVLIQSSLKSVGAGFRVVVPFETDGRRILLDRGFIRLSDRDRAREEVALNVVGNLHWPDEVDSFTPEPDAGGIIWFARDVPALADYLGTEPLLVVARSTDESPIVVTPLPVTSSGIPNDHLQYAVTWFLLALVWAAMTAYLIFTLNRSKTKAP